jgi:TP901 family phage tail tape measure protein
MGNPTLTVDIKANTKAAANALNNFAKKGETAAKGAGVSWGKVAAGATAVTAAVAGVAAFSSETLAAATSLNELLAQTQSLGVDEERINELKGQVQDLAVETGRSTDDIAGGLYQVVSALGDSAESMDVLGTASRLATAGVGDTKSSIELLTGVAKGYGDTSDEMIEKIADLSFQTIKLGVTDLPQLSASFGNVTGVAAPLGVQLEELYAILATTTGQGKQTSEVVTSMTSALNTFLKPAKDAEEAIHAMGYQTGEAMVAELGLVESLGKMQEYADKTGKTMAELMGRKEGAWLATVLLGDQYDTFLEKQEAMNNAAGASDQAFKDMTTGVNELGFKQEQLNQQWETAKQKIGDTLIETGLLEDGVDALTRAMEWLDGTLEGNNKQWNDFIGIIKDAKGFIEDILPYISFGMSEVSFGGIRDFAENMANTAPQRMGYQGYLNMTGQGYSDMLSPATREYMNDPSAGQFVPHAMRDNRGGSSIKPMYVQVVGADSMSLAEVGN